MPLFITSLNSGSNGNCYFVGNGNEAVLIDVGISCREIERRMKRLELSLQQVKAIFISHEHSDHIRGVEVLSRKHNIPVYITEATLKNSSLRIENNLLNLFKANESFSIGELTITSFLKLHDAADPNSFIVEGNGINIGVFTDIGAPCEELINHFKKCHAAFLEANYDTTMLEEGRYPIYLKNRIRGGKGHLSNHQALQLFITHKPGYMSHLILAHLSKENNSPGLVEELFSKHADGITITVASRYEETALFSIEKGHSRVLPDRRKILKSHSVQMSLFSSSSSI